MASTLGNILRLARAGIVLAQHGVRFVPAGTKVPLALHLARVATLPIRALTWPLRLGQPKERRVAGARQAEDVAEGRCHECLRFGTRGRMPYLHREESRSGTTRIAARSERPENTFAAAAKSCIGNSRTGSSVSGFRFQAADAAHARAVPR